VSSTEFEDVTYERDGHVATITFARSERLNAFRGETMRDFLAALDRADVDDDVRAVVVTGAGRAFCAGADISGGARAFEPAAATGPGSEPKGTPRDGGGILALRIHALKKPIIGAVNGAAVGMGATMTLPMDVRLASVDARFGFPFTRRGIIPEGCSSWFLPRVVGIATAAEWMLTGRIVDVQEAHAAGLVRSVHEPDALLPAAYELAREISEQAAPVSAAMTRQLLWRMLAAESPYEAHLAESRGLAARSRSDDAREGVQSFLEKRPPRFTERVSDTYVDMFED
jgi:enoyl-CoA hydratase/carnithine racemase